MFRFEASCQDNYPHLCLRRMPYPIYYWCRSLAQTGSRDAVAPWLFIINRLRGRKRLSLWCDTNQVRYFSDVGQLGKLHSEPQTLLHPSRLYLSHPKTGSVFFIRRISTNSVTLKIPINKLIHIRSSMMSSIWLRGDLNLTLMDWVHQPCINLRAYIFCSVSDCVPCP